MKRKITKNPETKQQLTGDILFNIRKLKQKLDAGKFTLEKLRKIDLQLASLI